MEIFWGTPQIFGGPHPQTPMPNLIKFGSMVASDELKKVSKGHRNPSVMKGDMAKRKKISMLKNPGSKVKNFIFF